VLCESKILLPRATLHAGSGRGTPVKHPRTGTHPRAAALTVAIAFIVLAYLLIYPAFLALRLRHPGLDRPFRVPATAWLVTLLATGWSLLVSVCSSRCWC
jgi:hypothetical protein